MDYREIKALIEGKYEEGASKGEWGHEGCQLGVFLVGRAHDEGVYEDCLVFLDRVGLSVTGDIGSAIVHFKRFLCVASKARADYHEQSAINVRKFQDAIRHSLEWGGALGPLQDLDDDPGMVLVPWRTQEIRTTVEVALKVLNTGELRQLTMEEHELINDVRSKAR